MDVDMKKFCKECKQFNDNTPYHHIYECHKCKTNMRWVGGPTGYWHCPKCHYTEYVSIVDWM